MKISSVKIISALLVAALAASPLPVNKISSPHFIDLAPSSPFSNSTIPYWRHRLEELWKEQFEQMLNIERTRIEEIKKEITKKSKAKRSEEESEILKLLNQNLQKSPLTKEEISSLHQGTLSKRFLFCSSGTFFGNIIREIDRTLIGELLEREDFQGIRDLKRFNDTFCLSDLSTKFKDHKFNYILEGHQGTYFFYHSLCDALIYLFEKKNYHFSTISTLIKYLPSFPDELLQQQKVSEILKKFSTSQVPKNLSAEIRQGLERCFIEILSQEKDYSDLEEYLKTIILNAGKQMIPELLQSFEEVTNYELKEKIRDLIFKIDPASWNLRRTTSDKEKWEALPQEVKSKILLQACHAGEDLFYFLERTNTGINSDRLITGILEQFLLERQFSQGKILKESADSGVITSLTELGVIAVYASSKKGREQNWEKTKKDLNKVIPLAIKAVKQAGYSVDWDFFKPLLKGYKHLVHNAIHVDGYFAVCFRKIVREDGVMGIRFYVFDNGAGIQDIAQSMKDGFTTQETWDAFGYSRGGEGMGYALSEVLDAHAHPLNSFKIQSRYETRTYLPGHEVIKEVNEKPVLGTRFIIDSFSMTNYQNIKKVKALFSKMEKNKNRQPTLFELIKQTNLTERELRGILYYLKGHEIEGDWNLLEEISNLYLFEEAV